MNKKILIIEDEPKIRKLLKTYLEKDKYQVEEAEDGYIGLHAANNFQPDLILLDLMLPEIDGLEVCRRIRQNSNVPIIMLTAKSEEIDKLLGLELGADDYITKPFSPREVVARVKAVLRRFNSIQGSLTADIISHPGLVIDFTRHTLLKNDMEINLTPTEFKILKTMMQNPERVFSRLQLVAQIQDFAFEGYQRTIDVHIKNIRQKIEDDPGNPKYIRTVYGVGYKFEPGENHA